MTISPPRVAVFGAGAFGGWTALELARRGAAVTLVDAWGPAHARASSGGSTRVIRAAYGSRTVYARMAAEARRRWQDYDARWNAGLLHLTGALWLLGADTTFGDASVATLKDEGIPLHEISLGDATRRYPQIGFDGVSRLLFEPAAGYLLARRACRHVAEKVVSEGGTYRQAAAVSPAIIDTGGVRLADGSTLEADLFVFACGPWLATLFPAVLGRLVLATRQEVYYFGLPPGDPRFVQPALPVWLECADRFTYGIPADGGYGFKVADDTTGPPMDPTSDERVPTADGICAARAFLARRFPALRDAPLVGAEVCQYESTPDSDFIIDRHPDHPHVWIAGGGSGHGFKMGPVIGEMVASLVLGDGSPDPRFSLARFDKHPEGGSSPKWA
jgi:sarcosine oxidase